MRSLFHFLFPLVFFHLFVASVLAQEITATLDFDNAPAALDCGSAWVEETFSLLATNNSQGGCSVENFDGDIFVGSGQLRVDLGGRIVSQIQVDIQDFCGVGCTRAFITQNGNTLSSLANQVVSEPETLIFDGAELGNATDLRIESFEGVIVEIRITYSEDLGDGPVLDLVPDPAAPGNPSAYLLCWTDVVGAQLEQSSDLQSWLPVPADDITVVGLKASYSLQQSIDASPSSGGRMFYRLLVDDTIIPE